MIKKERIEGLIEVLTSAVGSKYYYVFGDEVDEVIGSIPEEYHNTCKYRKLITEQKLKNYFHPNTDWMYSLIKEYRKKFGEQKIKDFLCPSLEWTESSIKEYCKSFGQESLDELFSRVMIFRE